MSECSICLEYIDNIDNIDKTWILRCNHVFHKECIKKWLVLSNTCPVCRRVQYVKISRRKRIKKKFLEIFGIICCNRFFMYMHLINHTYFIYRKNLLYISVNQHKIHDLIRTEEHIRNIITFVWSLCNVIYFIILYSNYL